MGVQYSLWGGSVLNLGTERHRKQFFNDIDQFRAPGESLPHFGNVKSFAGHGKAVKGYLTAPKRRNTVLDVGVLLQPYPMMFTCCYELHWQPFLSHLPFHCAKFM